MKRTITPLKELPLSDDFMFGEVMRQEKVCKLFLEALLGKEIRKIQFIEKQKDLTDSYINHGVRLDVYLNDEAGTLYNIEMQTTDRDSLERRIRYYQSAMDRNALEKGVHYSELVESYVIFICTFDYFKAGLAVYERESHIKGLPDISFNDGAHALILNSSYSIGNADPAILEFLSFLRNNDLGTLFQSSLMREVKDAVETVRNDEEKEVAYMTVAMKMDDMRRAGLEEGWKEGRKEGLNQGRAEILREAIQKSDVQTVAKLFGISVEDLMKQAYPEGAPAR